MIFVCAYLTVAVMLLLAAIWWPESRHSRRLNLCDRHREHVSFFEANEDLRFRREQPEIYRLTYGEPGHVT